MEKKEMKTLDEYNIEYKLKFKKNGLEKHPAGVICPSCYINKEEINEMFFVDKSSIILTIPRTQELECSKCSYRGKMLVGEMK